MAKAIWNGTVIAESDACELLAGVHYFPREAVNPAYLSDTSTHTYCPYKGTASYYTVTVDGKQNPDAAWYYPEVIVAENKRVENYIAFWHGVTVEA